MLLHKKSGIYFLATILTITMLFLVNSFIMLYSFPNEINVIQGQSQKLQDNPIFSLEVDNNLQDCINVNSSSRLLTSFYMLQGNKMGKTNAQLKLLGIVPIKDITLNVIPDIKVIPSGEAIGVKIESKGLLIVGLSSMTDLNGRKVSPAADAGFEVGDKILELDGKTVETERDIIDYLNTRQDKSKKIKVTIEREKVTQSISVQPVQCEEDNMYRIGLWVRDNIAGVGTMTFYDPKTNVFGALGHGITDIDSGVLVDINKGSILKSKVATVQKARKTVPGELVGIFYDNSEPYGIIEKNTSFGIYGRLSNKRQAPKAKPISIGLNGQIKEGPAKILTTIEGDKIEEFNIEIQKVVRQKTSDSKSMIIKITDQRLLEKTGGIVQGMSGSPIIQDNRLIGSVTHVLINDPTRGYGISIEWMLKEANIQFDNPIKAAAGQ